MEKTTDSSFWEKDAGKAWDTVTRIRRCTGSSLAQLAAAARTSEGTLSWLLYGRKVPSVAIQQRIRDAFRIPDGTTLEMLSSLDGAALGGEVASYAGKDDLVAAGLLKPSAVPEYCAAFWKKLPELCRNAGERQIDIAILCGVRNASFSIMKGRKSMPDAASLAKIAGHFHLADPSMLYGGKPVMAQKPGDGEEEGGVTVTFDGQSILVGKRKAVEIISDRLGQLETGKVQQAYTILHAVGLV